MIYNWKASELPEFALISEEGTTSTKSLWLKIEDGWTELFSDNPAYVDSKTQDDRFVAFEILSLPATWLNTWGEMEHAKGWMVNRLGNVSPRSAFLTNISEYEVRRAIPNGN